MTNGNFRSKTCFGLAFKRRKGSRLFSLLNFLPRPGKWQHWQILSWHIFVLSSQLSRKQCFSCVLLWNINKADEKMQVCVCSYMVTDPRGRFPPILLWNVFGLVKSPWRCSRPMWSIPGNSGFEICLVWLNHLDGAADPRGRFPPILLFKNVWFG